MNFRLRAAALATLPFVRPSGSSAPAECWASVIVPAHNEGSVIERGLEAMLTGAPPGLEIIVVVNGSRDDTAERASSFARRRADGPHRIVVVDVPEPGKIGALRRGWELASSYPRILVDADVEMAGTVLKELADAVPDGSPRVASPQLRLDTSRSDYVVRSWARVWTRLPYTRQHLVGSGVLAVNASGGARIAEFPDVVNDDAWIRRAFSRDERVLVDGSFTSYPPRTARALVARRARVILGNQELAVVDGADGDRTRLRDLAAVARHEGCSAIDVVVYALVTVAARYTARRRRHLGREKDWAQDLTSRQA